MANTVISADDHIDLRWLPKDLWSERLPSRLRERGPHVETTEKGEYWICDGETWGTWGAYSAANGSGAMWAVERGGVLEEGVLRPTVPELRLTDMDRDGVHASVLYGPTDLMAVADDELRRASYAAYNDWLKEFCAGNEGRLIGVPQLPMTDPVGALNEFERLAKQGFRHFNLMAAGAEPPVYDKAWEPFWSAAEESGIPIGFHLVVEVRRVKRDNESGNPIVDGAARAGERHPGMQLIDPMAGLIFTGVLDRHPKLKLVMAEAGIAWVPSMIQSLDNYYVRLAEGRVLAGSGITKADLPKKMPHEYFPEQVWITFQDDTAGVQMLGLLDENKIMWASDYPHPASTWPESQRIIEAQMKGVSDKVRQKLLFGNAHDLYGL